MRDATDIGSIADSRSAVGTDELQAGERHDEQRAEAADDDDHPLALARYDRDVRWYLAVVCLTGCGRVGFEPFAADPKPLCAIEGEPCDDLDICTTISTCSGGVCGGPSTGACEVARSVDEFSMTQGQSGWYYGYWLVASDANAVYDASDFVEFAWTVDRWRPPDYQATGQTFSWAFLSEWGGHPGSYYVAKVPVRRWVSDVSGYAEAELTHEMLDFSCGDGSRAILVVDGVEVFDRDLAGASVTVDVVPLQLAIGSNVDLLLHHIGTDDCDATRSEVVIRSQ